MPGTQVPVVCDNLIKILAGTLENVIADRMMLAKRESVVPAVKKFGIIAATTADLVAEIARELAIARHRMLLVGWIADKCDRRRAALPGEAR